MSSSDAASGRRMPLGPTIAIDRTWDGASASGGEIVTVALRWIADGLRLRWDAPFHGDPAPAAPMSGALRSTEGLWNHEVVELFIASEASLGSARPSYLEIELGPHGHHLLLRFEGVRRRVGTVEPLASSARISGNRWWGEMVIARPDLPPGPWIGNAYAIHGVGEGRRYLAADPVPGKRPDFHRLECFRALRVG